MPKHDVNLGIQTKDALILIIKTLNRELEKRDNIINYIWGIFNDGCFEDGCDCIKIYDYLKELKEGTNER